MMTLFFNLFSFIGEYLLYGLLFFQIFNALIKVIKIAWLYRYLPVKTQNDEKVLKLKAENS